jgi:hypothetical protein
MESNQYHVQVQVAVENIPKGSLSPALATEPGIEAASPVITSCLGTPTWPERFIVISESNFKQVDLTKMSTKV